MAKKKITYKKSAMIKMEKKLQITEVQFLPSQKMLYMFRFLSTRISPVWFISNLFVIKKLDLYMVLFSDLYSVNIV